MNQSVKTRFQFDECTIFLDLYDLTFDDLSNFVLFIDNSPRFRSVLLESQRDLALLCVHGEDLDVDLLADAQNFIRVLQLAP